MSRLAALFLAFVFVAVAAPVASAAPAVDGIYNLPAQPQRITLGPDGNVWATLNGFAEDYAKITPDGTVTIYNDPAVSNPIGITAGPGGTLWATQINGVVKFLPSSPNAGTVTAGINAIGTQQSMTLGPDGNIWTASDTNVVKIPPSNPSLFTAYPVLTQARGITTGTDGRLWVADLNFPDAKVVSVTTAGVATPHVVGTGRTQELASGPGGLIVFSNPQSDPQVLGRIFQGGTAQLTPTPGDPTGIALGGDGAFWVAQFASNNVGRFTASGEYSILPGIPALSGPRHITAGAGNTLWVALQNSNQIARITGVDPIPPTGDGADAIPPVVSSLSLTNKVFSVGKSATKITASKTSIGTKIRFTLSEASSVKILIERSLPGKKKGKKCVKPTKALKKAKAKNCKYLKKSGTLSRINPAGQNTEVFSGRIGKKALSAGNYKLTVTATDSSGNVSTAKTANFKIVAVPKSHK